MGTRSDNHALILGLLIGVCVLCPCSASLLDTNALLVVNASKGSIRKIPETLFGVFFEEINHAGAGGLWAELVNNRGFEAGGQHSPSLIDPWSLIGDDSLVRVSTDLSSPFKRNPVALRMEVLCDKNCPAGGVGIFNPGYWGMNIVQGKTYNLVLHIRSPESINVSVSLTDSIGMQSLASTNIIETDVSNWTKVVAKLEAKATNKNARLQLQTNKKGVIWFDQVSLMPDDTYKGHGFRNDLFKMVQDLEPAFIRFPGGCFVEGEYLKNAFRWKETVGPWEERPGHYGDVWFYWTDDALGHYEFFLEALDGIEFARGSSNSTWGSVRAAMGHPEPFDLKYVAIGNEDCGKPHYRENYLKFYAAIRKAYPDIQMISNCDASSKPLDHPADMYDYHIYSDASTVFSLAKAFDHTSRTGPKAFVSEYAVTGKDAGMGSLLASLGEAGFLIGLEKNSDAVEMASYAPLFVNKNNIKWQPDAIVFDSSQSYGTPSYWMQHFFKKSNGATLLSSTLQSNSSSSLQASAILFQDPVDKKHYLRVKVVNFGSTTVNLKIAIDGVDPNSLDTSGSKTVLSSTNVMDENSFANPEKITPIRSLVENAGKDMDVTLLPHSLTCFDVLTKSDITQITTTTDDSDITQITTTTDYVSSI
ncbi:alpha-L-arabinofuranosidase 1 [Artemisia annua]|uniref:non-reducing end alpha-L-arabinofuranosidase n=1 Tax=Artemisia annua TaxID=35608 RepID=A0A2U1LGA0_ARTAN|nr:alpha-L-arabinofuranosidase 1 [Artemisia annua]